MGMKVTQSESQTCVELDTGTNKADYLTFKESFSQKPANLKFDMGQVLYGKPQSVETNFAENQHAVLSPMMVLSADGHTVNWPMPQTDMFGFCNNYKAPEFMQKRGSHTCNQAITSSQEAAQTFLNPAVYAEASLPHSAGKSVQFTVMNVYKVDSQGKLTAASSTLPAGSCSDAVKEVFYTVYYKPSGGYYSIEAVEVDFVLQDFSSQCSGANVNSPSLVEQKFTMEFVPFTKELSRPKSGNPGYLSGAPLLISLGENEAGQRIVPVDGFQASSSYLSGACLAAGEQSQSASSVNFLEDLLLSCSINLGDEASFKSQCESDSFSKLQIAAQFEQWNQIGIFGNANISMQKDWLSVLATIAEEGGNTYDNERKMCKKLNVMEIEVLYSEIGFQANP